VGAYFFVFTAFIAGTRPSATTRSIAEQARSEGIRDLRASALMKAKQGILGLAEINRVTKD
jgi:type II secretory ATPase GspE/PulE/Tfp pilus assembly ATPase PilB-like protein